VASLVRMLSCARRTPAPACCTAVSWPVEIADVDVAACRSGGAPDGLRGCGAITPVTPLARTLVCGSCGPTARLGLRPSEGDND